MTPNTLPKPELTHVFDVAVAIAPPIEIGQTPAGRRRIIPITGGVVDGPSGKGRVLAGGADYQLIVAQDTQAHLDARYAIEMVDGAVIFVENTALRVASQADSRKIMEGIPVDPSAIYFRCQPRFETAHPNWLWLHETQFIGTGVRRPDGVLLSVYKVL